MSSEISTKKDHPFPKEMKKIIQLSFEEGASLLPLFPHPKPKRKVKDFYWHKNLPKLPKIK